MEYCYHCMTPLNGQQLCPRCGKRNIDATFQQHQLPQGTILAGRYLLGDVLGKGAFGITYIGMDLRLRMKIAVKEYYPSVCTSRVSSISPCVNINSSIPYFAVEGKHKFLQEARVLAMFRNTSGIVNVYDYFEENNTAYIVMEYLEGQTLKEILKYRTFEPDEIFALMTPVMDALSAVHSQNLIHRDISPDNLMLTPEHRLVLMDFGAAREYSIENPNSMTIMVKHGYAPEEQYRTRGETGPWTDVYALCATIYQCLTGIIPTNANERMIQDDLLSPAYFGVKLSRAQESALKRGLAVNAKKRIQTMDDLEKALKLQNHFISSDDYWNTPYAPSAPVSQNPVSTPQRQRAQKLWSPGIAMQQRANAVNQAAVQSQEQAQPSASQGSGQQSVPGQQHEAPQVSDQQYAAPQAYRQQSSAQQYAEPQMYGQQDQHQASDRESAASHNSPNAQESAAGSQKSASQNSQNSQNQAVPNTYAQGNVQQPNQNNAQPNSAVGNQAQPAGHTAARPDASPVGQPQATAQDSGSENIVRYKIIIAVVSSLFIIFLVTLSITSYISAKPSTSTKSVSGSVTTAQPSVTADSKVSQKEQTYQNAMNAYNAGNYEDAAMLFGSISGYSDATAMANKCKYQTAKDLYQQGNYDSAASVFSALGSYSDSAYMAKECKYQLATELYQDGEYKAAADAFSELGNYSDSADMVKKSKYQQAFALYDAGNYDAASNYFLSLGDYLDSANMVNDCSYQRALQTFNDGDYLNAYKQLTSLSGYAPADEQVSTFAAGLYDEARSYYQEAKAAYINDDTDQVDTWGAAREEFEILDSYQYSENYLTLIEGFADSTSNANYYALLDLISLDDARYLLLTRYWYEFFTGSWKTSGGQYYLTLTDNGDGTHHCSYNLPSYDVSGHFYTGNGSYSVGDSRETALKTFQFQIVDKYTITCYCYKDGSTYTLYWQ